MKINEENWDFWYQATVSQKFGHCSVRASLKMWWIITYEHWLSDEKEKIHLFYRVLLSKKSIIYCDPKQKIFSCVS